MPNDEIVWDSAPVPGRRDALLNAVKHVESRGNPNAVSPAGAIGPYQFMPATAKAMGVANPRDEVQARAGADKYLGQLEQQFGDRDLALLAYNWGPGNVQSWLKTGKGVKGQPMPPEAQQYVGKVKAALGKQPEAPKDDIVWDAPVKSAAPKQSPGEMALEGESFGKRALIGAGKAVADLGRTFGVIPEDESTKEADKALTEDTAGFLGNIGGEIALTALPATGALKLAQAPKMLAGATSIPGKILKHAVGGAAAGATAEGMMNRDPIEGAAFGAALNPAIVFGGRLLNEGVKQGQRFAGGAEGRAVEMLRDVFGARTPAAIAALRGTAPIVPGERVTAGLAANAQLPELAVLERGARGRSLAHEFTSADEATAAARASALEDIAAKGRQGVDPLTGAATPSVSQANRAALTQPLYESAKYDLVPVTPALRDILAGPEMHSAIRAAENEISQASRNAAATGARPPGRGRYAPGQGYTDLSVDMLQRIVKNLDPTNYNHRMARRLITDAMGNASTDFRLAQSNFRTLSQPQNQADIAAVLRDKLVAPAESGAQRVTAFSQALRDLPTTFRKADLSPRFNTMEEVFNTAPGDLQAIRGVESSLKRQAAAEAMPTNRGIVPEYMSPFDKAAQETPHMLMQTMTVVRSVLKSLGRMTDKQVQGIVDQAMTDPQAMAKLLESVPPTERNQIINQLRKVASTQGATVVPLNAALSTGSQ